MTGGYFEYRQYRFEDIAREIDRLILKNDCIDKDEFGEEIGHHYPEEEKEEG